MRTRLYPLCVFALQTAAALSCHIDHACATQTGHDVGHSAISLAPSAVFVQEGVGDQKTQSSVLGLAWALRWRHEFLAGTLSAYIEGAFGRWHTDGRDGATAWITQVGATPAFRLQPSRALNWFAEIGIGPSYIVPLFKTGSKRFSTKFNFDDHISVGREFGRSEMSLRVEHFSNAGISHPNPGQNFAQLRYTYHFRS